MLVWIWNRFTPIHEQMELYSAGDSPVFLTARIALASVTSFLLAILFGPIAINWLKGRFRERIDSGSERLNEIQKSKAATPTMGGIFIVGAIVISALLWGDLASRYVQLGLLVAIGLAVLGAVDDWIKLSTQRNGLRVKPKLLIQTGLSLVVAYLLYVEHQNKEHGLELIWPLGNYGIWLGGGFIAWSVLVLVGSSNAVNLTDGLDGLVSGCLVFAGAALTGLIYLAGHRVMAEYLRIPYIPGSGELGIVLGAMVGATLGFLWFNCYPAQVFMGDTGSLPMGGLLALAALVARQEVLLVVAGGIFVIETVSVILQVGWFRLTGNRLIACSPLHNHFLFQGQHEIKIVVRFWIGSALLAIIAITSLKIH